VADPLLWRRLHERKRASSAKLGGMPLPSRLARCSRSGLLVKRERFPEHPFAPISCMSVFGEAKRPPRRLGRLHPLDERQAGPGGLGMGAGVCGPTRQGGWWGLSFFSFQRGERKITPPHAQPAWTRLALIMGARLPRVSLTPANLAEPGPAWLHTVPYPCTTL
jgi:hypothetical protein